MDSNNSQEVMQVYILVGLLGFLLLLWLAGVGTVKLIQHCQDFKADTRERSTSDAYTTMNTVLYQSQHN